MSKPKNMTPEQEQSWLERKREIAKASYQKHRAERIERVAKRKRKISQKRLSILPSKLRKATNLGKRRKACECGNLISPHSGRYQDKCRRCSEIKLDIARWTTDPKIDKQFAKRNRKWWIFLASKGIRSCDKLPWGQSKLALQFDNIYWRQDNLESHLRKQNHPQFEIKRAKVALKNKIESRHKKIKRLKPIRTKTNTSSIRFFQMLAAVGQISEAMKQQTKKTA